MKTSADFKVDTNIDHGVEHNKNDAKSKLVTCENIRT